MFHNTWIGFIFRGRLNFNPSRIVPDVRTLDDVDRELGNIFSASAFSKLATNNRSSSRRSYARLPSAGDELADEH
jgi:hypothetical protein